MGATGSKIRVWAFKFCRALCKCSFTHPKIRNTLFLTRGAGSNLSELPATFGDIAAEQMWSTFCLVTEWYSSVAFGLFFFFFLHLITGRLLACLIALASLPVRTEKAVDHLNCSGGLSQGWSASPPWCDQIKLASSMAKTKALSLVSTPCQLLCGSAFLLQGSDRCKSLCDGGQPCAHSSWWERSQVEAFCSHPGCRAGTTAINSVITSLSSGAPSALWSPAQTGSLGWPF